MSEAEARPTNFIRQIVDEDLASGKHTSVHTRFPPEPNGYLHIGHAKSICLNFGIAKDYQGQCNLRFDDTNPVKEDIEFVESIKHDVEWLGFEWSGNVRYSSDYFDQLHQYAVELITKGLAYVDELSPEQIREYRGTLTAPGKDSPYRGRSVEENLALFEKMRNGEFAEGAACLRAKIDMASPFIVMRDPVLYRIKFAEHHQTGNKWCIYPMYDFTHCISDALEGITHSLCTTEFGITAVCMTGCWITSPFLATRVSTSFRVSTSNTPSCRSASCTSWWPRRSSRAGTIPVCRPSPVCAVAVIPPPRFASSACASA